MAAFEITDLAKEAVEKAKNELQEKYNDMLVGKHLYKSGGKRKSTYCGVISKVEVEYITQFGDVKILIWTDTKKIGTFGVNFQDRDVAYGYYYLKRKEDE